jgi:hypothetical protein
MQCAALLNVFPIAIKGKAIIRLFINYLNRVQSLVAKKLLNDKF